MPTLKQMYEELIQNTCRWSYYPNQPCLKYQTLFDETASYDFIKNYFNCAGKGNVFDDDPYMIKYESILKERSPHIISTFLLGILIAESLNFDTNTKDNKGVDFKYLWFLACLYHDIGYVYENDHNCMKLRMVQKDGLIALKEICDIEYLCDYEFMTYNKEYINLYLSNRAMCSTDTVGRIDHGIVGGVLLYDRLRKNFDQAWKNANKYNNNVPKNKFIYDGLNFSNKHYEYYAKAADAIIAHNIWLNTMNDYLRKEKKPPLKTKTIDRNNKLAFILALADTLEPIKKYGIFSLDMISFKKIDNGFELSMPNNIGENTYKYIYDLPTWVNVDVKECNSSFTIRCKEKL